MDNNQEEKIIKYAGFKSRLYASFIDTMLLLPIMYLLFPSAFKAEIPPELQQIYNDFTRGIISPDDFRSEMISILLSQGSVANNHDSITQYIVVGIIIILFWMFRSATPGKILLSMKIVDVNTNEKPGTRQLLVRYFGYLLSSIPPFLGFIWVAIDKRKQGWHDKIARTAVIYTKDIDSKEEKEKKFKRQTVIFILIILFFLIFMRG